MQTVFGTSVFSELQAKVPTALDIRKENFFQQQGFTFGYAGEKLFEDYFKIFPELHRRVGVMFGIWRGSLELGGVLEHPGQLKLNGLVGSSHDDVRKSIFRLVGTHSGSERDIEPQVDVFRDGKHRGPGGVDRFWGLFIFLTLGRREILL